MGEVAIAHDYLTQRGGAERVVLAMARAFPEAPIYTTLYAPDQTFPEFRDFDVRPSPINRVGYLRRNHRHALPLLALASSAVRVDADVLLVSSSGWAHGFRTTGAKIVYCHSPARWLYQSERYLGEAPRHVRIGLTALAPLLRRWDVRAAASAGRYLANSSVVQERIRHIYGRSSKVVPAPYPHMSRDGGRVACEELPCDGFFLVVSRLLPYKNVDAIVEAFRARPQHRLVVIGSGPERDRLRRTAPTNVIFLSDLTDEEMSEAYARCRALIAASYEDFGLTPVEAASHGKPSAVLRWGGFLDTTVEGQTAVFFDTPEPRLIADAVDELTERPWNDDVLRAHAGRFSEEVFVATLRAEIADIANYSESRPPLSNSRLEDRNSP